MKYKKQNIDSYKLSACAEKVRPLINEVVSHNGFVLVNVSFVSEYETNYLRLTISHKEKAVSLNDCELISREVEKKFDVLSPFPLSYVLEVQSPGIDFEKGKEEKGRKISCIR